MFHRFPEELGVEQTLVRSTDFEYEENPAMTYLTAGCQIGYARHAATDTIVSKALPPVEFEYARPVISETVEELDTEDLGQDLQRGAQR